MANVIHLVIRVHIDRKQPEKEQHSWSVRGNRALRQVQSGG